MVPAMQYQWQSSLAWVASFAMPVKRGSVTLIGLPSDSGLFALMSELKRTSIWLQLDMTHSLESPASEAAFSPL
jgi:hypothetical protein